jgi:integrase
LTPLTTWLAERGVVSFDDLTPTLLREYRLDLADRPTIHGRARQPDSLLTSHKAVKSFMRWAANEQYTVDARLLTLRRPKVAMKDVEILHVSQVKEVLRACNPKRPQEALMVRTIVGSGARAAEAVGLAHPGPDGLSDIVTNSIESGRADLRIRWNAGAKGRRTRRVPITSKLAVMLRKHKERSPATSYNEIFLSPYQRPYSPDGVQQLFDRLRARVGYRIYAHLLRHTWATAAIQRTWAHS